MGKWVVLTLLVGIATGCGGQFQAETALQLVNQGIVDKTGDRPACEIETAEYAVDTKVVAFELESDTGLAMGWDLLSGFLRAIEVKFRLKTGRLALALSLYDPLRPRQELMNVIGKARLWGLNFSFDLGFNQIGASFSHYSQTPFAKLSEKGLNDGLDKLTKEMKELQDRWSTTVVATPNPHQVVIPVGSFTGLKEGDQFAIYNVEHEWKGEPCHSDHVMARKLTSTPIAIGQVTQVENSAALMTVTTTSSVLTSPTKIEKGALVEIHQLGGEGRELRRVLQIGPVIGAQMQFENSQSVNIGPYLRDQIRAMAHQHGFTIFGQ